MDDMKEIMEDFLIEAFELIEQIDHDLVELEANPEDFEIEGYATSICFEDKVVGNDVMNELTIVAEF